MHSQLIDIGTFVVLGIGNSRLKRLADGQSGFTWAELKQLQRPCYGLAANLVRNKPTLLWRNANVLGKCLDFHYRVPLLGLAVCRMAPKCTSGCKLTQLMAHHVFSNEDRNVLATVMDRNRKPDKFWHHH
jgi:hypothetical protein